MFFISARALLQQCTPAEKNMAARKLGGGPIP
jgi:hypothetical protein